MMLIVPGPLIVPVPEIVVPPSCQRAFAPWSVSVCPFSCRSAPLPLSVRISPPREVLNVVGPCRRWTSSPNSTSASMLVVRTVPE
jgi:hypothetical protein